MQNSKPGSKLTPALKAAADVLYEHDSMRFAALARWVWWAQKQGWPDEAIAEALKMAMPAVIKIDTWWPYLTKLLPKAKGRASETESAKHKSEVGQLAQEFVEFARWKAERNRGAA